MLEVEQAHTAELLEINRTYLDDVKRPGIAADKAYRYRYGSGRRRT
ncbi:hypothetical protein NXW13_00765 [Bacteroides thetaiotaomicron]|nr:hypothetical protein [Bacteroides thetaiotaomicron]